MNGRERSSGHGFPGLVRSDLTVLFTIGDEPILKTRLQKIALLFDEMNDSRGPGTERGLRFFGGYSDDCAATKDSFSMEIRRRP